MLNIIRSKNFYLMLVFDSGLIIGSFLLAYILRFESIIPAHEWEHFYSAVPYILFLKIFSFWFFGLYKGMYRYISLVDLLNVIKATATSSAIIILAILFLYLLEGFPRSVFIIDWILTLVFIGGLRVSIRLFLLEKERGFFSLRQVFQPRSERVLSKPEKSLIIIGAGDAGEKMLREIRDNSRLNYNVLGFLDDDPRKQGMKITGVPLLGPIYKIQQLASQGGIDEILIVVPSASARQMRGSIEICVKTGLKIQTP